MAEDTLMDSDNGEERCSYWNQGDEISASRIFNKMGIVRQSKKGFHILATVCLGVLCVILLAVIISYKSHNCSTDTSNEAFQRLTSDNNSATNSIQSQTSCSNLNKQMDLLIASHNILIQEKSLLLTRYNNITDDRNLLQISYNNLILQKSQLSEKYNNLTREKELLQTNYTNLNSEKAKLQASCDNLTRELQAPRTKFESRIAEGWLVRKSSLYKVSSEKRTWEDSRQSCQNMGADLVIVNDLDEQTFIFSYKNAWIGLSDADNEGDWKWVDDTPLSLKYWSPGEPNDTSGEDCAEISSRATDPAKAWNDVGCSRLMRYICEDSF